MRLGYIFFIIVLALPNFTFAQSADWVYFSGDMSISSLAGNNDYFWIGSHAGPILFNKLTSKSKRFYTCNCKIPTNRITDVELDTKGNVWYGTLEGMIKFDGTTWTSFNTENSNIPDNLITFIKIDSLDNKWFGTWNGIGKFDGVNWQIYTFPSPGYVFNIDFDKNGDVWIGMNNGVYVLRDSVFIKHFDSSNSELPSWETTQIKDIAIDGHGNKWFATDGGLAFYNDTTWTIYNTSNSDIIDNRVNCITIDSNGDIWIGTFGGVIKFDGQIWSEKYNSLSPYGMQSAIWQIIIDNNQIQWYATDDGLVKRNGYKSEIFDFSHINLKLGWIRSIAVDDYDAKWIASDYSIAKFDGSRWNSYEIGLEYLEYPNIRSLVTSNDNIWVGTEYDGLLKFDGTNWTKFSTKNSQIPSDWINALAFDNNFIWIASNNGLAKFDGATWTVYNTENSHLPSNNILNIAIKQGDIWLITADSLIVNFINENQCFVYDYNTTGISPPPVDVYPMIGIAIDTKNNKWFTSNQGLVKFNGIKWETIVSDHSFGNLVIDKNDVLWMDSGSDLCKYDPTGGLSCVNSGMNTSIVSLCIDKRNNIWAGSGTRTIGVYQEGGVDMDITGTVVDFLNDSLNDGTAYLFNNTNLIGGYDTVAVTDIINGKYIFEHVADCGYTVFSEPGISYPDLLPSYLGDTLLWMGSDTLQVQASTQADLITLHEKPPPTFGNATITGEVVSDLGSPGNLKNTEIKDPIDNVGVVIIRKKKKKVVAYTQTDSEGRFSFRNIETGDYQIFMDYPGIPMDTLNDVNTLQIINSNDSISLHGTVSPTIIHLNREIQTKTDQNSRHLKEPTVFPNPFEVSTTIAFPNDNKKAYLFILQDLYGTEIKTISDITDNKLILMREDLPPGLYIFELIGEKKYSGKLLVE
jgi:ligand-binding sensor domain-containing protein